MRRRVITTIAWFLSVILLSGVCLPMTIAADTVSENSMTPGGTTRHKNTYMDIEAEMLDEDKMPRMSMFSVDADRSGGEQIPRSYRSDQVSENGVRVSYLPDGFRNQKPYGVCWAFSALGACEASLIRKGLATGSVDLSERHLAYYFYNKGEIGDPKGGTYGDYNVVDGNYLDVGGNSSYTMWHLASWCGPVEEAEAPYEGLTEADVDKAGLLGQENSTFAAYENDAFHVQNIYKIAVGDMDTMVSYKQTIKKLIMEYGALGLSYYSQDMYDAPEYDSYYNYQKKDSTNHAVLVVGWNDDFPKENFVVEAPGDGAWLIKNSWGDESETCAQDGFFWISYYDLSINAYKDGNNTVMRYAYVYDAEPSDNYDNIYQYDGDAMSGWLTLSPDMHIANRFTVENGKNVWEAVRSVGIGTAQSGVRGTVEIYADMFDFSEDPTAGTKMLSQEFYLEYPGYHTIKLNKPVYVGDGQQFTVVFRFDQETKVNVSYDYDSWVRFITYENPYVSYFKDVDGEWYDLADDDYIFRIKAYTDETDYKPPVLTGFHLSQTAASLIVGKTLQLTATQTGTGSESKVWKQYWISSDTSIATVSTTGEVTAVSPGQATIKVYNGNVSASCVVTVSPKEVTMSPKTVILSAVSLTSKGKAKLKWKKQEGVTGYQVFRATSENGKYKRVKTIKNATTVTVTLAAHTGTKPYYYKVRAYKTISGEKVYGAFSAVKSCAPKKTDKVKVTAKKGGKAKITWKATSGADGYLIYRATRKDGVYKRVVTIPNKKTLSFTDRSLKKGKSYYYRVRAYRLMNGKKVYGPRSEIVMVKAKK